ncbi:ABC transporter ATP-binding protein [Halorhabdus rudnickae]|uniref:ABC transporter ATP-binding protein n=1 Tax=Halorhabdus rudnickae TaxID=1775544 RepID=UPI001083904D|nr:ABC transporter ATP-binding protein [Halorhabdus rudnickae]
MTLDIRHLAFAYDDERVLDGINLTAESGELLGLLGPNGSGKSTLLECCNRLLEPDSGTVSLGGTSVGDLVADERARRIGYVPQAESRAFPASVFETILQGRRPHGGWTPSDSDRAAVEATIDRLDLDGLATRNVGDLSGGQRQKVCLGRALVGDPSVLLLDEPTSALDLKHRLDVMDRILGEVRDGVAGLIAIHDLNLAARYCDRVALLSDGRVYAVGEPDVLTPETVRAVYDVEASVREHGDRRLVVPESPVDREPGGSPALDRPADTSVAGEPVATDD